MPIKFRPSKFAAIPVVELPYVKTFMHPVTIMTRSSVARKKCPDYLICPFEIYYFIINKFSSQY